MKKVLILAAMAASAVSSQANATAACGGGSGANFNFALGATDSQFVKTAFTVKCSNNVFSNYSESAVALGVVAGSAKGKNYFGGGTGAGGIIPMGTCATTGCSTTEVSDTASASKRDAT